MADTQDISVSNREHFPRLACKDKCFGWSESERACCLRRKPIRKSLVRLLSEVAVCGCVEKHVEGTESECVWLPVATQTLSCSCESKGFSGAAAWVKRHSHVEYESMKSKIIWQKFYKENRTNILLCKLQQIFPVKMQWQPRQEFQAQDPGPREYTPWPRVAKLVSLYTIYYVVYFVICCDMGMAQKTGMDGFGVIWTYGTSELRIRGLFWRYSEVAWYKYDLSFLGMDQEYGS
jgi:hypothetical protein